MKDTIILVSKDVLGSFMLPQYGNTYWKTPNIQRLVEQGTIFRNHYTAAPSTAMSFTSMFTGFYPYQTNRKKYVHVKQFDQAPTFYDKLEKLGYDIHILWSSNYMVVAKPYAECFGNAQTVTYHLIDMNQAVGVHYSHGEPIIRNEEVERRTIQLIKDEYCSIEKKEKQFIWMHLPHVIKGRAGYGDDIDLLDEIIGFLIDRYGIENIYLTADHGHMNLEKGKTCYGFDVYQPAISIPLITPLICNTKEVYDLTVNIDLERIIINEEIPAREIVYSDCAYYAQPNRKLAIVTGRYKYIYNKRTRSEELYDLSFDPQEKCNLACDKIFDVDRKKYVSIRQIYFYPDWEKASEALNKLRQEKDRIWKEESHYEHFREIILTPLKMVYGKILNKRKRKKLGIK